MSKDSDVAITVSNLHKEFKLPHEKDTSIKSLFLRGFRGKRTYERQRVLKGISFEVNKGEFFGIVGRNGSGKSTLLKLLAGIYSPDKGAVTINGTLTPFIELGVGFNPELTGRENVYLNGALLGFDHKTMETMYQDIVNFAELERFMDQKLKNYSSGMQVRLAFSIAVRAKSDILLVDEVLAVGDAAFQRKCYEYFEDLKRNKKTVILVTHDMNAVEQFCDKVILIEDGEVRDFGKAKMVASAYSDLLKPSVQQADQGTVNLVDIDNNRRGDHRYMFSDVKVFLEDPNTLNSDIKIKTTIQCNSRINENLLVAYAVKDGRGQVLFGDKSPLENLKNLKTGQVAKCIFTFKNILSKGKYLIDLSIYTPSSKSYNDIWLDCTSFRTNTNGGTGFTVIMPSRIESDNNKNS